MAGPSVGTRPPEGAARIQALLAEIGTQLRVALRLIMAVFRLFYDFFLVACVVAVAVVLMEGKPHEAFVWGSTGAALMLGWVAARLARKGVARLRRVLREEWQRASIEAGHGGGRGPSSALSSGAWRHRSTD